MSKEELIGWEDLKKEMFTKEERKELDKRVQERLAIREIRELRKELNMTQEKLSIKTGIPRSTISKIENGKRNVSFGKLIKVADALNKDLVIKFVDRK